eukprot:2222474-Rhodomonas_salina.3
MNFTCRSLPDPSWYSFYNLLYRPPDHPRQSAVQTSSSHPALLYWKLTESACGVTVRATVYYVLALLTQRTLRATPLLKSWFIQSDFETIRTDQDFSTTGRSRINLTTTDNF